MKIRLVSETGFDANATLIKYLASCDGIPTCFAGIGNLEEIDEEIRDTSGSSCFAVGPISLPGNMYELHSLHDCERGQQRQRGQCNTHAWRVPPHILTRAIADAGGVGRHRTIAKIILEVSRKSQRCRISAVAITLDRLQRNPVQVAAQQRGQLSWIRATGESTSGCGLTVRANLCARAQRFSFPQFAQHIFPAAVFPPSRVKRQNSR